MDFVEGVQASMVSLAGGCLGSWCRHNQQYPTKKMGIFRRPLGSKHMLKNLSLMDAPIRTSSSGIVQFLRALCPRHRCGLHPWLEKHSRLQRLLPPACTPWQGTMEPAVAPNENPRSTEPFAERLRSHRLRQNHIAKTKP